MSGLCIYQFSAQHLNLPPSGKEAQSSHWASRNNSFCTEPQCWAHTNIPWSKRLQTDQKMQALALCSINLISTPNSSSFGILYLVWCMLNTDPMSKIFQVCSQASFPPLTCLGEWPAIQNITRYKIMVNWSYWEKAEVGSIRYDSRDTLSPSTPPVPGSWNTCKAVGLLSKYRGRNNIFPRSVLSKTGVFRCCPAPPLIQKCSTCRHSPALHQAGAGRVLILEMCSLLQEKRHSQYLHWEAMQGHPSAWSSSWRFFHVSFLKGLHFLLTLKQRVPPAAALSPAAAPARAVCSVPVCPPATAAGAHWWQTFGCRGSLWTLQRATTHRARATHKRLGVTTPPKPTDSQGNLPTSWPWHPHNSTGRSEPAASNRETPFQSDPGRDDRPTVKICTRLSTDTN